MRQYLIASVTAITLTAAVCFAYVDGRQGHADYVAAVRSAK